MEEIEEDTLYFFTKSNLDSKIDFRSEDVSKRNSHETKKKYDEEQTPERWKQFDAWHIHKNLFYILRFWSQVEPELISELNQDWSFKPDMDMFGYSPTQYFEQLSMYFV